MAAGGALNGWDSAERHLVAEIIPLEDLVVLDDREGMVAKRRIELARRRVPVVAACPDVDHDHSLFPQPRLGVAREGSADADTLSSGVHPEDRNFPDLTRGVYHTCAREPHDLIVDRRDPRQHRIRS